MLIPSNVIVNVHRLKRKNGDPATLILLELKNGSEEQHAKRYGIKSENNVHNVRLYLNKEKLVIRCFNCNNFGHLSNSCKNKGN